MGSDRDARLAEIRKRLDAATPGPWTAIADPTRRGFVVRDNHAPYSTLASPGRPQDADFIAHAREDVEWLLVHDADRDRLAAIGEAVASLSDHYAISCEPGWMYNAVEPQIIVTVPGKSGYGTTVPEAVAALAPATSGPATGDEG